MNTREKEQYLREYEVLKKKGKPFFPYAIMKDSVMMLVVTAVLILMSVVMATFMLMLFPRATVCAERITEVEQDPARHIVGVLAVGAVVEYREMAIGVDPGIVRERELRPLDHRKIALLAMQAPHDLAGFTGDLVH